MTPRDPADPVACLIASQREFYDIRAPDFGDEAVPDRRVGGRMPDGLVSALIWSFVQSCLRPGGRVAFVDEDDRGVTNDDVHLVDDVPVALRTLRDGRRFDVITVYWNPGELEARIRALDWRVEVRRVGESFLNGSSTR